ncbi:hypothetical protein NDU88_007984 [Pleurodeles waltl]|uniref:Uncharacterized protein n=1 Tax=Pleurodeles waltl TaxID=8319 RepID=A0AAV7RR10_PLEWA|nr:hypothetical protein NDU88_007984 [Pleurodeles waltl]
MLASWRRSCRHLAAWEPCPAPQWALHSSSCRPTSSQAPALLCGVEPGPGGRCDLSSWVLVALLCKEPWELEGLGDLSQHCELCLLPETSLRPCSISFGKWPVDTLGIALIFGALPRAALLAKLNTVELGPEEFLMTLKTSEQNIKTGDGWFACPKYCTIT